MCHSRPLAASSSKRVFHVVYLVIAAFFFYRAILCYKGQQRNGDFLASYARFTALEVRGGLVNMGEGIGKANASIGDVGLLLNGCKVAGGLPSNFTSDLVTIDFKNPTLANGYYFVTSEEDAARDPVRWLVEISESGNSNTSWIPVGAAVWEMTSSGEAVPYPNLSYPTPNARGYTIKFDQGYNWPMSLQMNVGGIEWTIGLICCVIFGKWKHGAATRFVFITCSFLDLLSVPITALGFHALGDWRNEAQSWLLLVPQSVLFVGMFRFEAYIVWVFALYAASIYANAVIILSLLYGSTLETAFMTSLAPGPMMGCIILDLVVIAFRWRARRRARQLVLADESKYGQAWASVQQAPDALSWIRDLSNLAVVLSDRCPSYTLRQIVHLPSQEVSHLAYGFSSVDAQTTKRLFARESSVHGYADGLIVRSLDQLYVQALCLHPILRRKVQMWAAASSGDHQVLRRVESVDTGERPESAMVQVRYASIKSVSRAVEKVVRCYSQVCPD